MTMNSGDLVGGFRKEIENALVDYRDMFENTDMSEATDPYFQTALQFFHELDDADREVLFSIIRQVMVDTTSNLFAIFDGVSDIPDQDGTFEVRIGDKDLAGSLQDQFLAAEEEDRV